MFAPEEYLGFEDVTDYLLNWVKTAYFAHVLEKDGKNPLTAFDKGIEVSVALNQYRYQKHLDQNDGVRIRLDSDEWAELGRAHREDDFSITIFFHCLLAKCLMDFEPMVCSPEGQLMRLDNYVFVHLDRLDWISPRFPLRDNAELLHIFELFDKRKFSGFDLAERYCFLDFFTGTLAEKNNSVAGFVGCSHFGSKELAKRYYKSNVRPFLSRAVVWDEVHLPDNFADYLDSVGLTNPDWGLAKSFSEFSEQKREAKKKGAKPASAKEEFWKRYPEGKPEKVSAEAIAAELTEAGFPVTGRTILNYSKEIKG